MSGSPDPEIDAAVTLWNTAPTADVPNPRAAVTAQLQGDAGLVARMRAEIARIEDVSGPRSLLHPNRPDYVSQQMHRMMTAMLASLDP